MRALVIAPEVLVKIKSLVSLAVENPVSGERLHAMSIGKEPPIGDDPRFVVIVPFGYRCAFSMEEQPMIGLSRHLSVSVDAPRKLPSPEAMAVLMEAFGFSRRFAAVLARGEPFALGGAGVLGGVWLEEQRAINVVEKAS